MSTHKQNTTIIWVSMGSPVGGRDTPTVLNLMDFCQPFLKVATWVNYECAVADNENFYLGTIQNPIDYSDTGYIKSLQAVLAFVSYHSSENKDASEEIKYIYKLSNLEFIGISNDGLITFHLPVRYGVPFAPWG